MTGCLFYTDAILLARPSRTFHNVKMTSYWEGPLLLNIAMEWNHGVISFGRNYFCYPMELRSTGVAIRPAVNNAQKGSNAV